MFGDNVNQLSYCVLLIALCVTTAGPSSYAGSIAESAPLSKTLQDSDIIAVFRITGYTADPTSPKLNWATMPDGTKYLAGADAIIDLDMRKPPGNYDCDLIELVKGKCPANIQVIAPMVLGVYYGDSDPGLSEHSIVLGMLRFTDGTWVPTDATLPFLPISGKFGDKARVTDVISGTITEGAIRLLVSSFEDAKARIACAFVLRNTRSEIVENGALPFADDRDTEFRQAVLSCLATNQVVTAIPKIVQLAEERGRQGKSTYAVPAIAAYSTPAAIPYLNPLLFYPGSHYIRIIAMMTLGHMPLNDSSIPYYIVALHDPEPQGFVSSQADMALHKLVPSLGPVPGKDYFLAHREEEIRVVDQWWSNTLDKGQ